MWGRQGLSSAGEEPGGVSGQRRSLVLLSRKRRPKEGRKDRSIRNTGSREANIRTKEPRNQRKIWPNGQLPQDCLPIGQERKLSGHRQEEVGSEGKAPAGEPAAGGRVLGGSRSCYKGGCPEPHPAAHSRPRAGLDHEVSGKKAVSLETPPRPPNPSEPRSLFPGFNGSTSGASTPTCTEQWPLPRHHEDHLH